MLGDPRNYQGMFVYPQGSPSQTRGATEAGLDQEGAGNLLPVFC